MEVFKIQSCKYETDLSEQKTKLFLKKFHRSILIPVFETGNVIIMIQVT